LSTLPRNTARRVRQSTPPALAQAALAAQRRCAPRAHEDASPRRRFFK